MLSTEFYSGYIDHRLKEDPIEFLDKTELKYLNHLAEKVLINFIRDIPKTNHIAASTISYYVEYFQKDLTLSKELIQNFCLWLAILKSDISFSEAERDIFDKIILQCKRFVQKSNPVLPDEQSDFSENLIAQQVNTLKSFNEQIKINDPNFRQRLVNTDYGEVMGKLYDAMRQAYSEGIEEGDIFFSNPDLAGICLNEIPGCRNLGQVYLGNIKDFQK